MWRRWLILVLLVSTPLVAAPREAAGTPAPTEVPPESVRRVLSFPNPELLTSPDFWVFVPATEEYRILIASQGDALLGDVPRLRKDVAQVRERTSSAAPTEPKDADRERLGNDLMRLAVLAHVEALLALEEAQEEHARQLALYAEGEIASPPPDPQVDRTVSMEACRQIVETLPGFSHWEEALLLLAYHLHASGRYHESNNVFILNLPKGQSWPERARELSAYSYFELARLAEPGSEAGPFYFAQAVDVIEVSARDGSWMSEEERLYRLAWARFGLGAYERSRSSLADLYRLVGESVKPSDAQIAFRKQVVPGLVATYFCTRPEGQTRGLREPAQQAVRMSQEMGTGLPLEEEVYRLALDLLWEHTTGAKQQEASRLEAYWQLAGAYLVRFSSKEECPTLHDRLVIALFTLSGHGELKEGRRAFLRRFSMVERERLIQLYGKSGSWRKGKSRKARDAAREIVRTNMWEMTEALHLRAQDAREELGRDAAKSWYRKAATAYEQYLKEFPGASETLEIYARLGDVYFFGLAEWIPAARWFARCRDFKGDNPQREEGGFSVMRALEKAVEQAEKKPDRGCRFPATCLT